MSIYTTQVKNLIASDFDFGLDTYPIFDEAYRDGLNQKILDHFYFREIGFETAGMFRKRLQIKLNEIMPYYNKLYQSELLTFNPLYTIDVNKEYTKKLDGTTGEVVNATANGKHSVDVTTTRNLANEGNSTTHNEGTGTNTGTVTTAQENNNEGSSDTSNTVTKDRKNVESDTPQGMLSIDNINNTTYASKADYEHSTDGTIGHETFSNGGTNDSIVTNNLSSSQSQDGTSSVSSTDSGTVATVGDNDVFNTLNESVGTTTIDHTNTYTEKVFGTNAINNSISDMLIKFRNTFLNIDMQVIEELNGLFMLIY